MSKTLIPEYKSINIFFGQKHQETFDEFETLSRSLRRSRTGTLHFLISHYKWYEKYKQTLVWRWQNQFPSVRLNLQCSRRLPSETASNPISISRNWFRRHMQNSSKSQVKAKIEFLERQLVSLDHYLPETYEYLMSELDWQRRRLAEMEVVETFQQIEATPSSGPTSGNSPQSRHPKRRPADQ